MNAPSWVLNEPISIGDVRVILVPDVVPDPDQIGEDALRLVTLDSAPSCWVSEQQVRDARALDPDALVFGLWQTVIVSGLVAVKVPEPATWIVWTDAKEKRGYWLRFEGAAWACGSISHGRIVGVAYADIEFDDATVLDPEKLQLPRSPALLPEEAHRASRAANRRQLVRHGLAVMLVAAVITGYWFWDQLSADSVLAQAADVQAEITALRRTQDLLLVKREPLLAEHLQARIEWHLRMVRRLVYLAGDDGAADITALQLDGVNGKAELSFLDGSPMTVEQVLEPGSAKGLGRATPHADGHLTIEWSS